MIATPLKGDLVRIEWIDIFEDSIGNPEKAELARRTSFGLFWGNKNDAGVECVVTTTTIDKDDHIVSGYCIYPLSCVTKLTIIKRARRPRKSKSGPA